MNAGRVVLLGATGYTGRIVLSELGRYADVPVLLVGRDPSRLRDLAAESNVGADAVYGDVTADNPLPALTPADVVISTVGPFMATGFGVVDAAIAAGAAYLDSTGEPPFIHKMYATRMTVARRSGATVIPAFGYDYVPGAAAAVDALQHAPQATGVRIGYFLTTADNGRPVPLHRLPRATTPATRASLVGVITAESFAYRAQATPFGLERQLNGEHLLRFKDTRGRRLTAISVGGAEHFSVPEVFDRVASVDVGLGWFSGASSAVHLSTRAFGAAVTTRPARWVASAIAAHLPWQDRTPDGDSLSTVIAEATGANGETLARAVWRGTEPYQFTGSLLAWGANALLSDRPTGGGVTGPIAAFGADHLLDGVRHAGIDRVISAR